MGKSYKVLAVRHSSVSLHVCQLVRLAKQVFNQIQEEYRRRWNGARGNSINGWRSSLDLLDERNGVEDIKTRAGFICQTQWVCKKKKNPTWLTGARTLSCDHTQPACAVFFSNYFQRFWSQQVCVSCACLESWLSWLLRHSELKTSQLQLRRSKIDVEIGDTQAELLDEMVKLCMLGSCILCLKMG